MSGFFLIVPSPEQGTSHKTLSNFKFAVDPSGWVSWKELGLALFIKVIENMSAGSKVTII